MAAMKYTVFLDRDGVINIDSADYIKDESEFFFIEKSPEAVSMLCKAGIDVIIITNQSAIDRGLTTKTRLEKIFNKMKSGIYDAGGEIKDIFYCPHHPAKGCTCRKPRPGLILKAQKKYGIDLLNSCMVGDSAKDIECAVNAGCGLSILVGASNGRKAKNQLAEKGVKPDFTAENLFEAVEWLLNELND